MKLFDCGKVGVFCDGIKHHNETRKSGDVKVITLTCRVDPFDVKLALALADVVRNTLFKLNHPDPQAHIRRCDFSLGIERQQLLVFAASDTVKASIAFDQVKIGRVLVRTSKDRNGYVCIFDATFGPVGDKELAYVEAWRGGQRAVSFEAAEANLEFSTDDEDDDEDDAPETTTRPTPMFDTDTQGKEITAAPADAAVEPVRQRTHSHADKSRKTH